MPRTGAPTQDREPAATTSHPRDGSEYRHARRQRPPSPVVEPGSAERRAALESAFLAWLEDPARPDELWMDRSGQPAVPIGRALGELSVSPTPLPDLAAARLGLPAGSTVGHAAAQLVVAVNDPAVERCRTYRSAVAYLAELDRPLSPTVADGQARR